MSIYFDWDDANIAHIAEHDVSPREAEKVSSGIHSTSTTPFEMVNLDFAKSGRRLQEEFLRSSPRSGTA